MLYLASAPSIIIITCLRHAETPAIDYFSYEYLLSVNTPFCLAPYIHKKHPPVERTIVANLNSLDDFLPE